MAVRKDVPWVCVDGTTRILCDDEVDVRRKCTMLDVDSVARSCMARAIEAGAALSHYSIIFSRRTCILNLEPTSSQG